MFFLFVPILAFYICMKTVYLSPSTLTDANTILNVTGSYIYEKSILFEVLFKMCHVLFPYAWIPTV
jgi:hypothetical protein